MYNAVQWFIFKNRKAWEKETFLSSPEARMEMSLAKDNGEGLHFNPNEENTVSTQMRVKFKYLSLTNYWLSHKTVIVLSV